MFAWALGQDGPRTELGCVRRVSSGLSLSLAMGFERGWLENGPEVRSGAIFGITEVASTGAFRRDGAGFRGPGPAGGPDPPGIATSPRHVEKRRMLRFSSKSFESGQTFGRPPESGLRARSPDPPVVDLVRPRAELTPARTQERPGSGRQNVGRVLMHARARKMCCRRGAAPAARGGTRWPALRQRHRRAGAPAAPPG